MFWGFLGIDDSVYGNEVQGAAMGALHFEEYFLSAGFSFCCFVRKDVFGNVRASIVIVHMDADRSQF